MPLMALEPPSVRPCGMKTARSAEPGLGSDLNCQVMRGLNRILMTPPGMRIMGSVSFGPASSRQTETVGSSVSRLASTQPAGPAPTIT